jgi:hypothetical protein
MDFTGFQRFVETIEVASATTVRVLDTEPKHLRRGGLVSRLRPDRRVEEA